MRMGLSVTGSRLKSWEAEEMIDFPARFAVYMEGDGPVRTWGLRGLPRARYRSRNLFGQTIVSLGTRQVNFHGAVEGVSEEQASLLPSAMLNASLWCWHFRLNEGQVGGRDESRVDGLGWRWS